MPSTGSGSKASLWLRTAGACVAFAVVTAGVVAFEVALFGAVSWGVFTVALGAVARSPLSAELGSALAVLGYAGVALFVFAAHHVARTTPGEGRLVLRVVVYVAATLVIASLGLTYVAIDRLGLPTWAFALVVVSLLAMVYPMALLRVGTDDSDDDDPPWAAPDESEQRTARADLRAIGAAVRDLARGAVRRLGVPGSLAAVAVVAGGLCAVALGARARSPAELVAPLSAASGVLFAVVHVWDVLGTELRGSAVLDAVESDLGRPVQGDALRALEQRVARLARQGDVPVPTVRLVSTVTPAAAAVGYRPNESTLVVSEGLVEALDDAELDAVLAHELAHVANRDAAVLTALSFPRAAARRAFYQYGTNPVVAVLAGVVAATSRLCVAVVARAREYAADDAAVALCGDPAALASALETLDTSVARRPGKDRRETVAAFSVVPPPWEEHPFFDRTRRLLYRGLLGTHPPTDRRVERLRATERDRETG